MSYTPINTAAYVASYSGAVASMAATGFLFQSVSLDYQKVTEIAGAFAQAFDVSWNNSAALNNLEDRAIQHVCAANFRDRAPGPLTLAAFSDPANWANAANAIKALVLECDVYFVSQGIIPGGGGGSGGITDPYDPASYLPAGTTPAEVDVAHGWKPYISACLLAVGVGLAQLGNRVYPTNDAIVVDSDNSIVGLGNLSKIELHKDSASNVSLIDGVTNQPTTNVLLKDWVADSLDGMKDTNQIFFSHPNTLTISGMKWYGYGNAANNTQGIAGVNIQGYAPNLVLEDLYSLETQAGASGDLTALSVTNSFSPVSRGWRMVNVEVDGGNVLKQCIVVDGYYNRNFRISQATVLNSAFTGLIVGYNAANAPFYCLIDDLVGSNCGGSAIYCTGNDGVPTYNTVAYGVQVTGAMVDSCGGALPGVFGTGIGVHHRYGSVVGCFVFNTGYDINGNPRDYANQCKDIDCSSISASHYVISGNWTAGGFYGYVVGDYTQTCTFTGNNGWNHTQAASIGLTFISGVHGQLTATGNTLIGTQYACVLFAGGTANDGTINCTSNLFFNPTGGCAVRCDAIKNGAFRNNTLLGSTPGVQTLANMVQWVGSSFMIDHNHFVYCGEWVNIASVVSQVQWAFAGPNTSNNYGAPVASAGPTPQKILYCHMNESQRWLESDAIPIAGEMPGGARYGDQIMRSSLSGGSIYGYRCTDASVDPGVWMNLTVS